MADTPDVVFEEEIKGTITHALHQAGWDDFAGRIADSAFKYAAGLANKDSQKGMNLSALTGELTVSLFISDEDGFPIMQTEDFPIVSLLRGYGYGAAEAPPFEKLRDQLQEYITELKSQR